ncbi:MAG: T9SS C-terminal target domain-containing protein [Ignavibacteriae bacterium]|nr:MAG: T9SS C-terminal target domain-containing protein [Ignavibacteriota bacterium]
MKYSGVAVFLILCFSSIILDAQDKSVFVYYTSAVKDSISWDFENEKNHGFTLRSLLPATPAADLPDYAGDESITGFGGQKGLPDAGVAWTIGPPNKYDGQGPPVVEGCHAETGELLYGSCNDPFGAAVGTPPFNFTNGRGQSGYLGTYQLNEWGDGLNIETNDQIATSPKVLLEQGAELTVWAVGNTTQSWAGTRIAPVFDTDTTQGYASGSGGIALLSAANRSLLANLLVAAEGANVNTPKEFKLDLSAFAGREVIIEVVDAFAGGWGWLMVDEIRITNATTGITGVENNAALPNNFHLAQNFPNPFNPSTKITFTLPQSANTSLKVFDVIGREIAVLVNGFTASGIHEVQFNAANYNSGVYFYKLSSGNFTDMKKMVLIK